MSDNRLKIYHAEQVSTTARAASNGEDLVQLGGSAPYSPPMGANDGLRKEEPHQPEVSIGGPLAQLGEPSAEDGKVVGSSPTRPIRKLVVVPISLTAANEYVGKEHRHNGPLRSFFTFAVGLADDGIEGRPIVGVALVGRTSTRVFEDGYTLEVRRVATDGSANANSMLYGAAARAAKAMGYRRLTTYTLPNESGASLRAAGWKDDGMREHGNHPETNPHIKPSLRDGIVYPTGPKRRWIKLL